MARPAVAVAVLVGLAVATVAGIWFVHRSLPAGITASPPIQRTPTPPVYRAAPDHFTTLAPGTRLPTGAECATLVRTHPFPENKAVNVAPNQATGHALARDFFDPRSSDPRADTTIGVRVDGAFYRNDPRDPALGRLQVGHR